MQRVREQRPFIALLSVLKHFQLILLLSSACTNKGGARPCVCTKLNSRWITNSREVGKGSCTCKQLPRHASLSSAHAEMVTRRE